MTDVVYRKIPHGKIPFATIPNQDLREVLMKLNENIIVIDRNVEVLCRAVNELKRRK